MAKYLLLSPHMKYYYLLDYMLPTSFKLISNELVEMIITYGFKSIIEHGTEYRNKNNIFI